LALGMAGLMRVDLGPEIRYPPFWIWPRFSRVQSESVLLPFGLGLGTVLRTGRRRPYSEPPGFNRPAGAQQPLVQAPPTAPLPWLCGPQPQEATLGFRPLPVFNALSGDHMTIAQRARHISGHDHVTPPGEPCMLYLNVDITHTAADVELVLRQWFSDEQIRVAKPISEDPSLPIRAMMTTNETQGLHIYFPSPP
jgi:hypothetical protein